jgi:AcrR family transcriptional regulator
MAEHKRLAKAGRSYRLQARAAAMERTRERITHAAVELHGTIGPAATTMSAVAELAGVTRATLYRHFPNEEALFTACSSDWLAANPRPDATAWAEIADPIRRLGVALEALYAYYRSTERMRTNLIRDIASVPEVFRPGIVAFPQPTVEILDTGWPGPSDARLRRAAIGHAIGFETWQSLAKQGLTDADAAELMVGFVSCIGPHREAEEGTSIENVLGILEALEKAGVPASIGGGWGIDALVGRQTRPHTDIDLCIPAEQAEAATNALAALGYRMTVDERPTRFVVAGAGLGSIDLHPLRFLPDGTARLPGLDGSEYVFPVGSLDAQGTIGGRAVRCFTREQQLAAHSGYEPAEDDLWDLALLGEIDADH